MLFSSLSFLYGFLPLVLIGARLVPMRARNAYLLAVSLLFYFCGEPSRWWLLPASALTGYAAGRILERTKEKRRRTIWMVSAAAVELSVLFLFKYADFAVENAAALTGLPLEKPGIGLPVGISFFTFQILGYVADVYRGEVRAQKSFVDFAAYVTLFPQLIAGPIVRYVQVERELAAGSMALAGRADEADGAQGARLKERVPAARADDAKEGRPGAAAFGSGIRVFVCGLAKKVLLANTFGELAGAAGASGEESVLMAWLLALAFFFQIYYDFSGYSDMAVGLGRMLGFTFPENFHYPYCARSVTEFWRRWHMTLGQWFRDYVYIPLGGNRVPTGKWVRNVLAVWALTGIWHGASWNFVLWGLYFGCFLLLERLVFGRRPGAAKGRPARPDGRGRRTSRAAEALRHAYTVLVVLIGMVLFQNDELWSAAEQLRAMFGLAGLPAAGMESLYYLQSFGRLFLLGAVGATPLVKTLWKRLRCLAVKSGQPEAGNAAVKDGGLGRLAFALAEAVGCGAVLLWVTGCLVNGSFNPFLYFRF